MIAKCSSYHIINNVTMFSVLTSIWLRELVCIDVVFRLEIYLCHNLYLTNDSDLHQIIKEISVFCDHG